MSSAAEKNLQALTALFGNAELASKLSSTRLGVVLPSTGQAESGSLLANVLADVLGRLWPNIDFVGGAAAEVASVCREAAASGEAPTQAHRAAWLPPYDVTICVGCDAPPGAGHEIHVGANDWSVQFGEGATCGNSTNPVGPAFAAALAAAQAFFYCFRSELDGFGITQIGDWSADVRSLFGAPGLEVKDVSVGETHVFGVGAVTHGMAWLLEHWPATISGHLHLVDGDDYGAGNGQRYAFMRPRSAGMSKVDSVAARLRRPTLEVTAHRLDLNSYCERRGYERPLSRVIVGLDSEESRRQTALKLPRRAINMWTSGMHLGAGQYVPASGRACLACAYPEPLGVVRDEVGRISSDTGLRPDQVRELLDSTRGMTEREAASVALHRGIPAHVIVNEPLRSVLPVLCATGRLVMSTANEVADVPFAFSSLLAGIAGFVLLMRDIQMAGEISEECSVHTFKAPAEQLMRKVGRHAGCVRCDLEEALSLEGGVAF